GEPVAVLEAVGHEKVHTGKAHGLEGENPKGGAGGTICIKVTNNQYPVLPLQGIFEDIEGGIEALKMVGWGQFRQLAAQLPGAFDAPRGVDPPQQGRGAVIGPGRAAIGYRTMPDNHLRKPPPAKNINSNREI